MGRKKKVLGWLTECLRGRPIRVHERLEQPYFFLKSKPHGQAAHVWVLTTILKERAPLVYAFIVDQMKKPTRSRDAKLYKIRVELHKDRGGSKGPSSRELLAYVIERAMGEAWEAWSLKRPYSTGDHDAFFRRYVHGHPGAVKVFRQAIAKSKPWPRFHVGHELRWFLGAPGAAAQHYGCLTPPGLEIPVLRIIEE